MLRELNRESRELFYHQIRMQLRDLIIAGDPFRGRHEGQRPSLPGRLPYLAGQGSLIHRHRDPPARWGRDRTNN